MNSDALDAVVSFNTAPAIGVGIGYRFEIAESIYEAAHAFDCVEIVSDQFIGRRSELLSKICDHFKVIPHGVGMSLGSVLPPAKSYLQQLRKICLITGAPYYSEHLSLNRVPGIEVGHLAPVLETNESFNLIKQNINIVQDFLGLRLCLENITYSFSIGSGGKLAQADMLSKLVRSTGCSILLDVANLYINSQNHDFVPLDFLEKLPMSEVMQIHLAGGLLEHGEMIDSHNRPISEETWTLYNEVMLRCVPSCIIIERDADFPPILELVNEASRARRHFGRTY